MHYSKSRTTPVQLRLFPSDVPDQSILASNLVPILTTTSVETKIVFTTPIRAFIQKQLVHMVRSETLRMAHSCDFLRADIREIALVELSRAE